MSLENRMEWNGMTIEDAKQIGWISESVRAKQCLLIFRYMEKKVYHHHTHTQQFDGTDWHRKMLTSLTM